ncbi:MAG: glycosyltransferase [Rhodospirillaceae bacterium]|nr:glycosyltransferase [Rhodospirillaceae bacterium]|tara:strand:- start:15176 stop:16372 length:1197 start_codon:yes stop_codon:yes gene_type:complete
MNRKYRLAYLVSHPIQYQAPLLRQIAADPDIDLTVFFCSDISIREHVDEGFGQVIEWDTPLLDGYKHQFLKSWADDGPPSVFRPVNSGLPKALKEGKFDALWVHGYMRFYHLISMFRARIMGLVVLNRDEAWEMSAPRGPLKKFIKRLFFSVLRKICHGWLVIGSANKNYYLAHGMQEDVIFPMPYTIDNQYFSDQATAADVSGLRAEFNLEPNRPIILYASKFMGRKRPKDLVEAVARLSKDPKNRQPYLLMVGDGEQREALKKQVEDLGLEESVRFTGFRNQSELPSFYSLCDVFVLPSFLEPWGLVVNEVMTAGRAVIASDQVGSVYDLIKDGENGFVFPAGNVDALTESLSRIVSDPTLSENMGKRSLEIIENWGFREDIEGLKRGLNYFLTKD